MSDTESRRWQFSWTLSASRFTESLPGADLRAMFGFPPSQRHAGVRADEISVYFADFERVAKWEVHGLVTGRELENFTASLAIGGQFWCIQRFAGPPIVFVHTDGKRGRSGHLPSR